MWLSPIEINGLDIELPNGEVKTEKKDQSSLIAELISRVTSLEDAMEYVLEHMPTTETEICDECVYVKGSQWCNKCDGKPKRVV